MRSHYYSLQLKWIGNTGNGTKTYTGYSRNHEVSIMGKPTLPGSSDPAFRGDPTRYNPEELLLAAIANCHMLWFLHFCSENKIVVEKYEDNPTAIMQEKSSGAGRFIEATLHPNVTISSGDTTLIDELHEKAHQFCFVAQSLNFPVKCEGTFFSV
jgi:organic hydroperoxide reductase OsmC/OhrA